MDKKQAETTEERFKALLRELFQFTKADLNFGIYRVMNHKREEWGKFIDEKIVAAVDKALSGAGDKADSGDTPQDILRDIIISNLGKSAFNAKNRLKPDYHDTPYGKLWLALEKTLGKAAPLPKALRDEVFNRLYEFFSRYYDEGDFMCKRRHSAAGRYAIPYNGEEVLLHWANRDQYYIKTAEHFLRYEYKTGESKNAAVIRFEMRDAKLPKDNNKANGRRYFIPLTKAFAAAPDEGKVFVLPFEYRPLDEKEQSRWPQNGAQDTIIDEAVMALTKTAAPFLTTAEDGEPLITRHIRRYARRNTADYFIHKNLRRFLREELDFYIKNEVLNAEEIAPPEASGAGENTKARFIVAGATRQAARMAIDFLAQMENFQKAIWEKKKFITQTEYCLTVGMLKDNKLREKIAASEEQWAEWRALNFCNGIKAKAKRLAFMNENPTLPLDTVHFDGAFKDALLAGFDDLEESTDGVLFHGENWQALNLMQEKYRERIKCVYIDPPYNTDASAILYKNDYKNSSWLSLMENRVNITKTLLSNDSISIVAIDDIELRYLTQLLDSIFGEENYIGTVTTLCNPQGRVADKVSKTSEFHILHAKMKENIGNLTVMKISDKNKDGVRFQRTRTNSRREERPNRFYPMLIKNNQISMIAWEEYEKIYDRETRSFNDSFVKQLEEKYKSQGYKFILPENQEGEFLVWQRKFERAKKELETYFIKNGVIYTPSFDEEIPKTLWDNNKLANPEYGTELLKNIVGEKVSQNTAKSVHTIMQMCLMNKPNYILDYFAGSGTTAHAVINLNRKDGGRRKFVLVEMGEYFDTVLLPRIKKVIYTPEWKEGKPKRPATKEEAQRAPRLLKYYRMESYDDALDNIAFDEEISRPLLKFDDYAPRYMLQTESRACATFVSNEKLKKPFAYTLRRANKEESIADLPETFAYLIGLKEKTRRTLYDGKRRYVVQTGEAQGRQTTVIWRDTDKWENKDFTQDREFVNKQKLTANAERVYVNDDSIIKNAQSLTPIFHTKMFPANDED